MQKYQTQSLEKSRVFDVLSSLYLAEGVGFEPTAPKRLTTFRMLRTRPDYAISPRITIGT